ncbi:MHS family MFS transporter [Pseudonocardia kujensis]|uniref:MFS transporter n=1 Tax=Pseudonocardia kujensis TaxID=1128675 RepID=UPI001E2C9794|nr:MFS transporter [Pseudonocardia kujensis]MCE0767674.1 MHS family MFS transporter [Pseudonocardia kujensis]
MAERGTGEPTVSRGRIAVAGFIGTTIEFFDFYAYGIAAALVLNAAFFPTLDPVAGTLAAFSTNAVAFVSRPLGSALFGHWGDRLGRKSMLIASLLTMGLATAAVGVLPGYASIGVAAPILLVVLRFVQGIGLGGEWGGAALLAAEHAPPGRRGLYTMFPQLGPAIGFIAANGIFLLLATLVDDAAFASWGWRVPFLASALLVVVGLYVRLGVAESPVFTRAEKTRVPLLDLVRTQPRELLLGAGAMIVQYSLFYIATTYCLSYGTRVLHIDRTEMLLLTMIAVVFLGVATALSATASDRFGRRRVVLAGCAAGIVWGPVMFALLDTANPVLVVVALGGALAIMGLSFGPMAAFLPELFATRTRYSGASIAYSLGGVLGGAVPPLVATSLEGGFGGVAIGLYLSLMAVISLLCVLALSETRDRDLAA